MVSLHYHESCTVCTFFSDWPYRERWVIFRVLESMMCAAWDDLCTTIASRSVSFPLPSMSCSPEAAPRKQQSVVRSALLSTRRIDEPLRELTFLPCGQVVWVSVALWVVRPPTCKAPSLPPCIPFTAFFGVVDTRPSPLGVRLLPLFRCSHESSRALVGPSYGPGPWTLTPLGSKLDAQLPA